METKELTILEAVEKVHQISRDSMLILERHDTVKTEIKLISDYFQINKITAHGGIHCHCDMTSIPNRDALPMSSA